MSELKITGTIKVIGELQTFDSGFKKVEFVVTTEDQYPQDIKFEIVQDKTESFLKFNKVGHKVDVSFNIRGNEYNGKHYVSLGAWKVFKSDSTATTEAPKPPLEKETEDLPF